ncbi:MAG: hypothetical protein OXI23_04800, partial [Gemmatimonadota bacterium]|nr:hypothetical protein [Gemmatimonadota bacterium]
MFLKKSLLFTTALALLMFAGQVSAQSVSLTHVPGEGGSEGKVSGSGTAVMVKVSTTGVNALLAAASSLDIAVAFDKSLVSLTGVPPGLLKADTATGATLTLNAFPGTPLQVPEEAILTFTTVADVTGVEFSIGIAGATAVGVVSGAVQKVPIPITAMVMFNGLDVSASLTREGDANVKAGDTIVVNLAVGGLEGIETGGAKIVFAVAPAVAAITGGTPATGLNIVPTETSGMQVVVAGLPMMLTDGALGSVTFTVGPAYDGESDITISVASLTVFTTTRGAISVPMSKITSVTVPGVPPPPPIYLEVVDPSVGTIIRQTGPHVDEFEVELPYENPDECNSAYGSGSVTIAAKGFDAGTDLSFPFEVDVESMGSLSPSRPSDDQLE